ncbi:MAG: peptide ABC transporter substrate-binding protein [Oscillospiraceae bacterium]
MKKRIIALALCIATICSLLCSCKGKISSDVIRYPLDSDPVCLDPQIAVGNSANILINNCFEGLVRIGEGGKIIPGVAKSWKISADSLTYTFKLRSDAKWFLPEKKLADLLGKNYEKSFDTKVTAHDFVFGIKRAIDPQTQAPNADSLFPIKNAQAVNLGKLSSDKLGIMALDDNTLEIKLDYASINFLSVLATPVAMPCNEEFFSKTSGRYGLSSLLILCNGPFYLSNWEKDSTLFLNANEDYSGENKVLPTSVRLFVNTDPASYITKLTAESYDAAPISKSDNSSLPAGIQVSTTKYKNTVWSLCFNNTSTTLSDTNLRLALGHATDSSIFGSDIGDVATGIVPSSCVLVPGSSYRANSSKITPTNFNEQISSAYWNKYLQSGKSTSVSLSLLCTKEHEGLVKKMIQQWQKLFGIEFSVSIVTMEKPDLAKRVSLGNYEVAFAPITANEFLASDFLSRFGTGNFGNVANYSSGTYDTMLSNIRKATDKDKVLSLCNDAESYLINNGVILPAIFEDSYVAVSKNVEGLYFYPSGENVTFIKAHHTD